MAGNPGGPLDLIGITPQFVAGTVTTGVSAGAAQVFYGMGKQSLLGQAGQTVINNVASNAVNVGINSLLGTQVAGAAGLQLNTGANILASVITPSVSSNLAAGINQSIQQSLKSAGPLGPILSQIGTGFVNQAVNGLTNLLTGATTPGSGATATLAFPGAGDEPDAQYSGGGSYTLGTGGIDVVFAIRPANWGPLSWGGLDSSVNAPSSGTTLPLSSVTNPANFQDLTKNILKAKVMQSDMSYSSGNVQSLLGL